MHVLSRGKIPSPPHPLETRSLSSSATRVKQMSASVHTELSNSRKSIGCWLAWRGDTESLSSVVRRNNSSYGRDAIGFDLRCNTRNEDNLIAALTETGCCSELMLRSSVSRRRRLLKSSGMDASLLDSSDNVFSCVS